MRIALDLDGTLYDSMSCICDTYNQIRQSLGYPSITIGQYRNRFQSKDWKKLCVDTGIAEHHVDTVIDMFVTEFAKREPPILIPGAKETIRHIEKKLGAERVYILTNEPAQNVRRRFVRDSLENYLSAVRNPFQGKAKELYEMATGNPDEMLIYVGDLVSDGEACVEAADMGADNIAFFAITHEYAMNTPEALREFIKRNSGIFAEVKSLEELADLF